MATVESTVFQPGETTDAADANQPHSDIQTNSAAIDQDNTRTEWATIKHFTLSDKETHPVTPYLGQVEDETNVLAYNNTAWATISNGGLPMSQPAAAFTLNYGDILRLHGGALVNEVSVISRTTDVYWFRFVANMSINGAAAADVQLGPDFGYSLGSRAEATGGTSQVYGFQRVGQSWIHVCLNTTEEIQIEGLRYQVKLENGAHSIELGPAHFTVIRSTH